MSKLKQKREKRFRRYVRVRSRIFGTNIRPRLVLFRSNRHIWTQLIDDESGKTLVAISGLDVKGKSAPTLKGRDGGLKKGLVTKKKDVLLVTPMTLAEKIGELLAQKARERKINSVVFDRGPYKYHGLVKAVAEGARKGGLKL